MSKPNIKGHISPEGLISAIIEWKTGRILNDSIFHGKKTLTKEEIESSNMIHEELMARVRYDFLHELVMHIMNTKDEIKQKDLGDRIEYTKSLLILDEEDLKHCVEYCIRTMPKSAITNLRGEILDIEKTKELEEYILAQETQLARDTEHMNSLDRVRNGMQIHGVEQYLKGLKKAFSIIKS